ncbi:unnamed protein product [Closterium sp. NIES-54]
MEPKLEVMSHTSDPLTPFEEPEVELTLSDQATPALVLSGEAKVAASDQPTADVAPSDQPTADIAASDQPMADIVASVQPTADIAASDQPAAAVAASDQPTVDIVASDQPTADIAASVRPTADIAVSDQPTADIAVSGQPTADMTTPDQAAADVASTKVINTNETFAGNGGAYSEGAYSGENVHSEPPPASFRESNLINVQGSTLWSHTEVRLLLEAHAELDAEFHAVRGSRGTNYYKELLNLLLQRDPEFRHSADAIKAKINRLKSNYENLRDRLEWADRLEQSEPSRTPRDFAARLQTAQIPDRLPEWFVLMDPIMTRHHDRRQSLLRDSRDNPGRWHETRFDSPMDRRRSSALLLGIARAIAAGKAAAAASRAAESAAAAGGQAVEAADMKAGTSGVGAGTAAAAGSAEAAATYAAALRKVPAAGAGQSNLPQSNRPLLPLLRSAAPPSRAPRGRRLSSSPHPPASGRRGRPMKGMNGPDRLDRLDRLDRSGVRGRADELGEPDELDGEDGADDGPEGADGWIGRRRKRGSAWCERELPSTSRRTFRRDFRGDHYEGAFPAVPAFSGREAFSGGERAYEDGDVMVERACADFEEGMQEWAESLCCQFEDSVMEFAEAAFFQFKSLTREFRDSWTAGRGAKRYKR